MADFVYVLTNKRGLVLDVFKELGAAFDEAQYLNDVQPMYYHFYSHSDESHGVDTLTKQVFMDLFNNKGYWNLEIYGEVDMFVTKRELV